MGCLVKLLIVLPLLLILIIPAMFMSLFSRSRRTVQRQTTVHSDENHSASAGRDGAEPNRPAQPDKPIDESEVEFIDFEEIKDATDK